MQTFYLLKNNYLELLNRLFHNTAPFTTQSTPEQAIATMEVDFPRTSFVSPYITAKELYQRATETPELRSYYAQGNFEARETSGSLLSLIDVKLVMENKGYLVDEVKKNLHSIAIHYDNDAHQSAGLSIYYLEQANQNPIWVLSHVEDLSQPLEQRAYTFLFSPELENLICYDFHGKKLEAHTGETIESDAAGIFARLQPKLQSKLISHLLEPIFHSDQPALAIKALDQRLHRAGRNLDDRDEKIEGLTQFLHEFAPEQLEAYQQRFIDEFDFFEPEHYLQHLKALRASITDAKDGCAEAFQKLLMAHLALVLKNQDINDISNAIPLCQGSPAQFETHFHQLLKDLIHQEANPLHLDRYLAIYQVYLRAYPEIFDLEPEAGKLEVLKAELIQEIQSSYAAKIEAFKQSLVQDLSQTPNYWQARQDFLAQKQQELQKLNDFHQDIMHQIPSSPELRIDDAAGAFKPLAEYQDLLKSDLASIYQIFPELERMKPEIEAQAASTTNYFAAEFYPQRLALVFQQVHEAFPALELSEIEHRLMKRAKDLEVRHKTKISDPQISAFCGLYFQSASEADYSQKISAFLTEEIETFKASLVLTEVRTPSNDLDIAQTKWKHRETILAEKSRRLNAFNQRLGGYLNLVNQFSKDTLKLECGQILDASKREANQAFEAFKTNTFQHQNGYRQVIQDQGLVPAMQAQFKAWANRLPKINIYEELLAFRQNINTIFQKMLNENDVLNHSDADSKQALTQEFEQLMIQVNNKIQSKTPPSFASKLAQKWQDFPYKEEALVISAAIATAAICNPLVVGTGIALGVAAISIGLILFVALRILAQMMVEEAARPSLVAR